MTNYRFKYCHLKLVLFQTPIFFRRLNIDYCHLILPKQKVLLYGINYQF